MTGIQIARSNSFQTRIEKANKSMIIKRACFLVVALLATTWAYAASDIVLKKSHPSEYTIKQGDTLWDIASRFLRDPWRWPDIWHVNPQIKNPHLIYPGDQVVLTFKDGKPQLILKRANNTQDNLRTVKLSPTVRTSPLRKAIPTIPVNAIQQFLSRPHVMTEDELENAPYILSIQDDHLISGAGDTIYVRGIVPGSNTRFSIVRSGAEYIDKADDDEVLGVEAIYVGEAVVENFGDPTTLTIAQSDRETLRGDRLVPAVSRKLEYNFTPHAPSTDVQGNIISVLDGVSRIGQHQIVVINRGLEHGMEKGHVMTVLQSGAEIDDDIPSGKGGDVVLPAEQAGYILLFRIFNKVSYALVMKATREIRLLDIVKNP